MRKRCGGGFVAFVCLALTACASQPTAPPVDTLALLRSGAAVLGCREPCLADWRRVQPQAAQLDAAARWQELAALVLGVGYQDDLSLYYLGRAAEGLGYPGAAASYYRQSTYLTGTVQACDRQSLVCGGFAFPRAAAARLAAIEREITQARPRRSLPATPRAAPAPGAPPADIAPAPVETAPPPIGVAPPTPLVQPEVPPPTVGFPSPFAMPAPAPAPAPATLPEPPPAARRPGTTSDYIEPPAAR